ncbi:MAG: hypothetical protein MI741_03750, partial [Rhodospirillales bacterium]|nr:hypothetical protein [Rhodospirillales bacterium]
AEAGATVIVFRHRDRKTLLGQPVDTRRINQRLKCRADHSLRHKLSDEDLQSLMDVDAEWIRFTQIDKVTPVVFEPLPKDPTGSVDALLAIYRMGKGRFVLCQLPLQDWQTDPRTRQIFRNALELAMIPIANEPKQKPESPTKEPESFYQGAKP